ncbi:MAG: hypothetical protein ACFE0J_00020 [Elainellaceae cyanobacterium]
MGFFDDYFLGDDEKQALDYWRQQKASTQQAAYLYQQGVQYRDQNNLPAAIELFIQAIHTNHSEATYWNDYAYTRCMQSYSNQISLADDVLDAANTAVMLRDDCVTRFTRGWVLLYLGRLPEALFEWSVSVRWNRNNEQLKSWIEHTLSRVFISYGFNPLDQVLAEGLELYLKSQNFSPVTGKEFEVGSVPQKVRKRISNSFFLIAILTQKQQQLDETFSTSNWLIAEASAARALNRQVILMVEQGINRDSYSCVLGDEEYITFNRNNYTSQCGKLIQALNKKRQQIFNDILQGRYTLLS